jgi:glycosyltransferase involved in cell wall biosynthesis
MNKLPVSVVISAFNEEKKIVDCIKSVAWADEIIVVDNTSTDKTAALAKEHGANVLTRENNLMLNVNKNYGFDHAKNEWLISLDADERMTPELAEEIDGVLRQAQDKNQLSGFWIPRKNIIFGKWIRYTGWYPDYQLRLFKKSAGRFPEKHIHEMISVLGSVGYLEHPMTHYNYETIPQFLHKTMVIYTPNEAAEKLRTGYTFHYLDAIRFPVQEFLRRFFTQEGYKDGFHGLMLSLLMAFYHFIIFCHIWETQGFKDQEHIDILHDVESEMKKSSKEFVYWFSAEKLKRTSDPLKKVYLRVKRKLRS